MEATDERPAKLRKLDHDPTPNEQNAPEVTNSLPTAVTDGLVNDAGVLPEAEHVETEPADANVEHNGKTGESPSAPTVIASVADTNSGQAPGLSKNQQKKLRKQQEWESKRDERKAIRKEKIIAKRERKREAHQKAVAEGGEDTKAIRRPHPQRATQLPVTIVIDCNFDDLMRVNERISLGQQLTRSYSDNKNSKFRAHITICSWGGHLKERFDTLLSGVHESWRGTRFLTDDFVETSEKAKVWMSEKEGGLLKGAFSKYADLDEAGQEALKQNGEVVYLSSESNDTLTELKPYSTYIIGGLVDKNREKGICYKRATQAGVRTARLPIGDYLEMASRKVLTTNHVNEIMLKWLECGDWGEAFMQVIPKRKGGKLREDGNGKEASQGAQDEDGVVDDAENRNENDI